MNNTLLDDIRQRQQLTEAYASFSRSRGGLGKVLGGVVGLVVIMTGTLLGGSLVTALLTIGATLIWLVGKEIIRDRIYQPLGSVQEVWPQDKRREHLMFTGFVGLIAAGVTLFVILNGQLGAPQTWVYLAFVVAMPFLTWRFLRTPMEFIVGVFLLAACAVHGAGGAYTLIPSAWTLHTLGPVAATWSPFIGSFVLIAVGLREHRDFQKLAAQMQTERQR